MFRILTAFALVLGLIASQANAATVYFRGSITTSLGGDPLGLFALPSQILESFINTNGSGGITNGYIVFQGKAFDFSNGTFGGVAGNNQFGGINLVDQTPALNPSGVMTITIPGPVEPDTQAGMNNLIGRPAGTILISVAGATYFGGIAAIPEPSSMLVLTGLVACVGAFSRRRKQAA